MALALLHGLYSAPGTSTCPPEQASAEPTLYGKIRMSGGSKGWQCPSREPLHPCQTHYYLMSQGI